LQRCLQFAQIQAKARDLPLVIEPDLRELHFGDWEGISARLLQKETPTALGRFWANPIENPPPGGERLDAFRARVDRTVSKLVATHIGASLLVVTHGGPIRYLITRARCQSLTSLPSIEVSHGAMRRVQVEETCAGSWRLVETTRDET
jgi:alpha-ribazole phosphatase